MDSQAFRDAVRCFLSTTESNGIITNIPGGSGVFHIANVSPSEFSPMWVSHNSGRFSDAGEAVRYYANEFNVSARELGYPPGTDPTGVVFIAARMNAETSVFDVHGLPSYLQMELYEDKDPKTKWDKSHILMETVREDPRFTDIKGTYYPSASGQILGTGGSCLALFCQPIPTTIINSGDYQWWLDQKEFS